MQVMPPTSGESAAVNNDELPAPECPRCYYNLTGLSEDRCPECGQRFDRDQLRRVSSSRIRPAGPWDRDKSLRGFTVTWLLSVFEPNKMARGFPALHDGVAATAFSMISYACAAAAILVGSIPGFYKVGDEAAALALTAIVILPVSCMACEIAVAGVLAGLVRPTCAPGQPYFWRGLTHYTSGHAIMSGVLGGLWIAGMSMGLADLLFLWVVAAFGVFMSWCVALWRIVGERGRRGARRTAACLLIPVIGAASAYAGLLVAVAILGAFF